MILASIFYFVKIIFKVILLNHMSMQLAKHKLERQNQVILFLKQNEKYLKNLEKSTAFGYGEICGNLEEYHLEVLVSMEVSIYCIYHY